MMKLHLGKKIAPPRFIAFVAIFIACGAALIPLLGYSRGFMAGFDIAAAIFLASLTPLLKNATADQMRKTADANDANRAVLLGITGITMIVILVAVAKELRSKSDTAAIILVILTLILSWLYSNTIYALHYAHLFYSDCDGDGNDQGGLEFPNCSEPDYWDFIYFSFTLGMTFQTSDVEISSRRMRFITLGQCLAAFVFNLGVLAFTINTLGGG
jgi:uncharacterized membrane protein